MGAPKEAREKLPVSSFICHLSDMAIRIVAPEMPMDTQPVAFSGAPVGLLTARAPLYFVVQVSELPRLTAGRDSGTMGGGA
jgi:hypothetical protein